MKGYAFKRLGPGVVEWTSPGGHSGRFHKNDGPLGRVSIDLSDLCKSGHIDAIVWDIEDLQDVLADCRHLTKDDP